MLYDKLGVKKNASKEDIKKAYRQKAKETHPDKEGGDNEKMTELTHAYDILSNDNKKARYDSTGEEKETPFAERFMGFVNDLFIQIIDKTPDIASDDLIEEFRSHADKILKNIKENRSQSKVKIEKYISVRERVISTTNKHILLVMDSKIETMQQSLASFETEIEFIGQCIEVLKTYEYKVDEEPEKEMLNDWDIARDQIIKDRLKGKFQWGV